MRRTPFFAAVIAVALAASAPLALAQDVMVDPDSPSGSEYQLPVERERDEASPGGAKPKKPGERSAPAFGEGIESGSDSTTDSTADDDSGKDTGSKPKPRDRKRGVGDAVPTDLIPHPLPTTVLAATTDAEETGSTGIWLVLGLGALTLAAGLGGGAFIRRRRDSTE